MPAPPFIYDPPSAYAFSAPTARGFNPRAATQASWAPKVPSSLKQDGPLIDFNKHPDSYSVPQQAHLNVTPMHPNTRARVQRARYGQLFLRVCVLLGALGLLFCVIAINKTSTTIGWIIRVAPAVALVHTVYAIYHLCRAAEGRTPASTASYMIFAALVDAGLIPFLVFSAIVAYLDYNNNEYSWNTLFDQADVTYQIIKAFFLLNTTVGGILLVSLILDAYLAVMFRKISQMPPDMNPLEPTLTSRPHKRNKSSLNITEKHMSNSTLVANRELGLGAGKRIPFIHTRTDSADSVTLYGNDDARQSRASMRKDIDSYNQDPYRQSRSSYASSHLSLAPTAPTSAVKTANGSRAAVGLGSQPERMSMASSTTAPPASRRSYMAYEGVPFEPANQEFSQEAQPLSPVGPISSPEQSPDRQRQEQQNWYSGYNNSNASRVDLSNPYSSLAPPATDPAPRKRSREPLGMNPPTPRGTPGMDSPRAQEQDENLDRDACPYDVGDHGASSPSRIVDETFLPTQREALLPTNGNTASRPLSARPSSFVGSGGKTRFYGNLRNSFGSLNGDWVQAGGADRHPDDASYYEGDEYDRTKTMQSEGSGNIQIYASDSEDDQEPTHNQPQYQQQYQQLQQQQPPPPPQHNGASVELMIKKNNTPSKNNSSSNSNSNNLAWNSPRQVSNSTAHDLHSGYAGLGAEFGKGMATRRREVSGKVVEEGRSPYTSPDKGKLGAAGWARFKGL